MNTSVSAEELLCTLMREALQNETLRRVTFSKPLDKSILRVVARPIRLPRTRQVLLHTETFCRDNKALQANIDPSDTAALQALIGGFLQINLSTGAGDAEYRRSGSGNSTLIGAKKLEEALRKAPPRIEIGGNNREKAHILTGNEPFLQQLGVSDATGRVHDKRQAKFRQINRFLELIRDVEPYLPQEGVLHICDLCCGKSYLSFAVYHYFSVIRGRRVRMEGVDLKPDVIAYCNEVAQTLGWDGLRFSYGNVAAYETERPVHMVISLHACDTATDLVLDRAMHWQADVILSTPCCHHALNRELNCPTLDFIAAHSMLRQKFCDAATDAMRLKLLEANGYRVAALELIDPEETPKNILLRGIRKKHFDPNGAEAQALLREYREIRAFLTGKAENDDADVTEGAEKGAAHGTV